jgi:hypothetical protein
LPPQVGKAGAGPGPAITNPNQGIEETKSRGPEQNTTQAPIDTPKNEAGPQQKTAKDSDTRKADLSVRGAAQKTALQNQLKETVIRGTSGNDIIHVSRGKGKYELEVDVNGSKQLLTKEQAKNLVIDAGNGNDLIHIDGNVNGDITIKGGSGKDLIIDERGNDYIIDRGIIDDPENRITGGSGNVDIDGEKGK